MSIKPDIHNKLFKLDNSVKTLKISQSVKHGINFKRELEKNPKMRSKFINWKESEKESSRNIISSIKNSERKILGKNASDEGKKVNCKDPERKCSNKSSKNSLREMATEHSSEIISKSEKCEKDENDEYSSRNINVMKKYSKNDDGTDFIKRLSLEMESKYEKILDEHYIDCSNNLPENYEDYIVQNLNVIKNMQFFFNESNYDDIFAKINKKVLDEINLDYSKPYLIFDLDETLIHSELIQEKPKSFYDKTFKSNLDNEEDNIIDIGIMIRPGSYEFLNWAKQYFRLGLITAAEITYAHKVLECCEMEKYFDFTTF